MKITSKLTHTLRCLLLVAIYLISSCRTTYKTATSHLQDSLAVSTLQRVEWQRSDSASIVNLSNLERIGKVWTTWERYDTLGRLIERATSHSEERTKQADSSRLAHTTAQATHKQDSTSLSKSSIRETSTTSESKPAHSSLLSYIKWLALALIIGIALGIYVYHKIRS